MWNQSNLMILIKMFEYKYKADMIKLKIKNLNFDKNLI